MQFCVVVSHESRFAAVAYFCVLVTRSNARVVWCISPPVFHKPYFAFCEDRVGASLAGQEPIKCAQHARRSPSGAPSPRWDCARHAEPFHVTWFTFGGGQIARGVTRPRRAIGATECGPRLLPRCASHPRQMQRAQTKEVVNVSLVLFLSSR